MMVHDVWNLEVDFSPENALRLNRFRNISAPIPDCCCFDSSMDNWALPKV